MGPLTVEYTWACATVCFEESEHERRQAMKTFDRITVDPAVMGGKACVRGLRVTVGTVVGLLAAGRSPR